MSYEADLENYKKYNYECGLVHRNYIKKALKISEKAFRKIVKEENIKPVKRASLYSTCHLYDINLFKEILEKKDEQSK